MGDKTGGSSSRVSCLDVKDNGLEPDDDVFREVLLATIQRKKNVCAFI